MLQGWKCGVGAATPKLRWHDDEVKMQLHNGDNKPEGIEEDVDEDNLRPVMMKWLEVMKLIKWSVC